MQNRSNRRRKGKRQREIQRGWGPQKRGPYNYQEPEALPLDNAAIPELESTSLGDMKVINLSDFQLENRHLDLLKKGLSFLPTSRMDHFEVYKDLCLFLRKVYYKLLYSRGQVTNQPTVETNEMDTVAINQLVSPLQEGGSSLDD